MRTSFFYSNFAKFRIVNFKNKNSQKYKKKLKFSVDKKSDLKNLNIFNMIKAGIIGTGIGLKHFEAINNYRGSKVICILEKNKKRASSLKKKLKYVDIVTEEKLFLNIKI